MPRSLEEMVPNLTARSVILSLLLGVHPPRAAGHHLVQLGEHFGIAANTTRVALSRMVASGDLLLDDADYSLAPPHLERQRHTEAQMNPEHRESAETADTWCMIVLTGAGRSAAARSQTRADLLAARFAELREGVWLRPDNLQHDLHLSGVEHLRLACTPENPRDLAAALWDLDTWRTEAETVLHALNHGEPLTTLRAAAAATRLMMSDPALPASLLPTAWPAADLRAGYLDFRHRTTRLIETVETAPSP